MTARISDEVDRRRRGRRPKPHTIAAVLAAEFLTLSLEHRRASGDELIWPSARYRKRPVEFFREVIGVEPWSRQIEVIEAVRDYPRVAVASGHKVSKSHTAAGLALWFYCSFPDGRVVMSSTTSRQVDTILWRELRIMRARSLIEIDGEIHELARSGLKADDFREIVGFTAREAEAVAGISGRNVFYIIDESSGVPDVIFEAIEGNRAGGARVLLIGNPTRTEGEFFEAFHRKSEFYKTLRISSEESPNVVAGREVIPGLATSDWIDEKRREWGEDSALYKVRIKGEFVTKEDGKILTLHAIATSELRWPDEPGEGRLFIGLDPAGPGGAGDESVMAPRRGKKILELAAFRGLTEEAHLVHLLGLIKKHRKPREELPVVVVDREGSIGPRVFGVLRAYSEVNPDSFYVAGVRSSDRAFREPMIYDRVRDELWSNLEHWMRDGGAIPEDTKLARELHAPSWFSGVTGRLKATSKEDLRKILGRSPDRADAVCLATWEPVAMRHESRIDQGENIEEPAPPGELAGLFDSLEWTRR